MRPALKTVSSQPAWTVRNRNVELAVTRLGGQMAPVTFCRNTARPVRPYYVSPWQTERHPIDEPVVVPLRGDFFCMPFGENTDPFRGEKHACHGEPAMRPWRFRAAGKCGKVTSLTLSMRTKIRPGKVTKTLSLVEGHNVVYSQHVLEGYTGSAPVGHHGTLAVPDDEGALLVSTSDFKFGLTTPTKADPAAGCYQSFALGKRFTDLSRVPLIWKDEPVGDCTAFPVRAGFTDILAVFKKPGRTPAWTAAVNAADGYLWFSLKDASVLPTTVFWISNRGLHGAPWLGRNRCLGLEDVCGFLAQGLGPSVKPNAASRAGIPTAVRFSPRRPTAVRTIQGAVRVPRGFGRVARAKFARSRVTFVSTKGKQVAIPVHHEFLTTGEPA